MCAETRPRENTARKQPSVGQGERPQGEPNPGGTLILDLQPLEQEKINLCALSHTVSGILLWHFQQMNTANISGTSHKFQKHLFPCTLSPPPSHDKQKCLQILHNIFWGDKIVLGENHCLTIHTAQIMIWLTPFRNCDLALVTLSFSGLFQTLLLLLEMVKCRYPRRVFLLPSFLFIYIFVHYILTQYLKGCFQINPRSLHIFSLILASFLIP